MVTRGWNGYRNKSQHRKSTLEKKILPPFQQGFEPATFQSRVRRSNHWAIPAPYVPRTWVDPEYSFAAVGRILLTIFAKQKFAQLRTNYIRRILSAMFAQLRTGFRPTSAAVSSASSYTRFFPSPSQCWCNLPDTILVVCSKITATGAPVKKSFSPLPGRAVVG